MEKNKINLAIQVTQVLDQNSDREINGIIDVIETLGVKKCLILTLEQEKKIKIDKNVIHVKPLWKWLID